MFANRSELEHELSNLLPFTLLKNIDVAAKCLADAIARQARILVVGDYDADGATATALAVRGLSTFGAKVDFWCRTAEYGYGLTLEIVALAATHKP